MSKFNEATRVQMPAMAHLTRLGYIYFGKIHEASEGIVYDGDTNILLEVFKKKFEDCLDYDSCWECVHINECRKELMGE